MRKGEEPELNGHSDILLKDEMEFPSNNSDFNLERLAISMVTS